MNSRQVWAIDVSILIFPTPKKLKKAVRGRIAGQCRLGSPLSGFSSVEPHWGTASRSQFVLPGQTARLSYGMPSRGGWAAAGCISGLSAWAKEQEPTCPLSQPPPALSVKCQQAREGRRRDRQAVNPQDAGAWVVQAQAPRQLFWHVL